MARNGLDGNSDYFQSRMATMSNAWKCLEIRPRTRLS